MLKVLKFGGSSLADAEQFRKVAAIVKSNPANRYVVASAPGKRFPDDIKVTDLLLECYRLARKKESIDGPFGKIEDRFRGIIADLGMNLSLESEFATIRLVIKNRASRDYVASRGEYLNSMILAEYLGYAFLDAEDAIFFTDDGSLDLVRTDESLQVLLSEADRAVIPGFYGSMPNGTVRTFSRGGSDITGSIVARASKADLYENWTDVSGMLMADPRIVSDPEPIPCITYRELRELSYMGASVMHEDAIFPVREAGIPINIRNTNCPEAPGTMIVASDEQATKPPHHVTGISGKRGFSAIHVEKSMMNGQKGFGRRVLQVLEEHGINFEHLPSSIDTMSVVVNTAELEPERDAVIKALEKSVAPDHIDIVNDLALLAVVGRGMVRAHGTAYRVFKALASVDVNVRMIDQGSSELNIIVGIDAVHYEKALEAIYKEFVK
ncbi:MAG: aspartate kinase [Clostridia bacterium]|nr:aspartate kinase [Clostridia bacterium]